MNSVEKNEYVAGHLSNKIELALKGDVAILTDEEYDRLIDALDKDPIFKKDEFEKIGEEGKGNYIYTEIVEDIEKFDENGNSTGTEEFITNHLLSIKINQKFLNAIYTVSDKSCALSFGDRACTLDGTNFSDEPHESIDKNTFFEMLGLKPVGPNDIIIQETLSSGMDF